MSLSLRERVEELEEENRQLRALKLPPVLRYRGIRLTGSERCLIAVLVSTVGVCAREYLLNSFEHLRRVDSGMQPKTLNILMVRIRKKLRDASPPIAINTEYGVGYYMTPENKALLAARREI